MNTNININAANQVRKPKGVVKITCARCNHAYAKDTDSVQTMYKGVSHWLCLWCAAEVERNGESGYWKED